mgnify:FL=1
MAQENSVQETLNITGDQLERFLTETGALDKCSCGHGVRKMAQEPDGRPSLNALQDPRDPDSENWFFWTVCTHCLRADFYSAGHIWLYLSGRYNAE